MRIIPRIDIKNNYVIKGINLEGLRKIGDPKEIIENYSNEKNQILSRKSDQERTCLDECISGVGWFNS